MVNSLVTVQGPGGLLRREPGPERTPNIPALYETLDRVIQADAEGLHDQRNWVSVEEYPPDPGLECRTAACFCGWRALQDGGQLRAYGAVVLPDKTILGGDTLGISWTDWGAERFGLTIETAQILFHENNTVEDLKSIVDEISAGELR
jgi:hypothetical protein